MIPRKADYDYSEAHLVSLKENQLFGLKHQDSSAVSESQYASCVSEW